MIFLMDVLRTKLEQRIDYTSERRAQIGAIIPYLYVHNLSSGIFKLSILKNAESIFEKQFSKTDLYAELLENFGHVYFPVVPIHPLPLELGEYTFRIEVVSDYSATGNSFIGWIKQHEDIQLAMSYNPISDVKNTYTIRFKEFRGIHD